MKNYEELAAEADKYFPYYNGYYAERKLPEVGQVVLVLTGSSFPKIITYNDGVFDTLDVYRWWPTRLTEKNKTFVLSE